MDLVGRVVALEGAGERPLAVDIGLWRRSPSPLDQGKSSRRSAAAKARDRIKAHGKFTVIIGWVLVLLSLLLPLLAARDEGIAQLIAKSEASLAITIAAGTLLIILGSRVMKDVNRNTKRYVWVILVLSGLFGVSNFLLDGGKGSLMLFLFAFSFSIFTPI